MKRSFSAVQMDEMAMPEHAFAEAIAALMAHEPEGLMQQVQYEQAAQTAIATLVRYADDVLLTDWVIAEFLRDFDMSAHHLFRGKGLSRAISLSAYASKGMKERLLWFACVTGNLGGAKKIADELGCHFTNDELLALTRAYVEDTASRSPSTEDELRSLAHSHDKETQNQVRKLLNDFVVEWQNYPDI